MELKTHGNWKIRDRARVRKVLVALISKLQHCLQSLAQHPDGFSARQEYRISIPFLTQLAQSDLLTDTPSRIQLAEGHHFPYYALRQRDVVAFIEC